MVASSRAAVKEMDLSALQGRKVVLYVSVMGDQGSGFITGGYYSVEVLIRGGYQNNPDSSKPETKRQPQHGAAFFRSFRQFRD